MEGHDEQDLMTALPLGGWPCHGARTGTDCNRKQIKQIQIKQVKESDRGKMKYQEVRQPLLVLPAYRARNQQRRCQRPLRNYSCPSHQQDIADGHIDMLPSFSGRFRMFQITPRCMKYMKLLSDYLYMKYQHELHEIHEMHRIHEMHECMKCMK